MPATAEQRLTFTATELPVITAQTAVFAAEALGHLQLSVGLNVGIRNIKGALSLDSEVARQDVGLEIGNHPGERANFLFRYDSKKGAVCEDFQAAANGEATRSRLEGQGRQLVRKVESRVTRSATWRLTSIDAATTDTVFAMTKRTAGYAPAINSAANNTSPLSASSPADSETAELWVPQRTMVPILAQTAGLAARAVLAEEVEGRVHAKLQLAASGPSGLFWHANGKGVSSTNIVSESPDGKIVTTFKLGVLPDIAFEGSDNCKVEASLSTIYGGQGVSAYTIRDVVAREGDQLVRVRTRLEPGQDPVEIGKHPATVSSVIEMAHFASQLATGETTSKDF